MLNPAFSHDPILSAAPDDDRSGRALADLFSGESLDEDSARSLFEALVDGRLSNAIVSAMLIALRLKGETASELTGAARALRAADLDFPRPEYLFADSCGTGGDGSGSINISTASAFVAAACGLPVAKHGNRSFTSRCGSADVLEALGANIETSPERSRALLDEIGFCFLFAPLYHPGVAFAGPARRALGVPTIMNLVGPCVNPAEPAVQLLGVADPVLLAPVAETLRALGVARALVVHGAGFDEVALHDETVGLRLTNGAITPVRLSPEEAGLERRPAGSLKGGNPAENGTRLLALLSGNGDATDAEMVALNAGALLMTAGIATDLRDGVAFARDAIVTGEAGYRLRAFIEASNA